MKTLLGVAGLGVALATLVPSAARVQGLDSPVRAGNQAKEGGPTFNRDVAPIFYRRCVTCHRPGEVAPMSLLTYRDARPWARAVRSQVAARTMPPWFADPLSSRPFANDNSLTTDEMTTIIGWVDAGGPEGDGLAPVPPSFVDGWHTFKNRPPDAVVEMPAAFEVPTAGVVPVFTMWSPNPFAEDKFIEAVELRPGSLTAVHHSDVTARALPAGTVLGRGRAWSDGPVISFVPMYPDGRSFNELTSDVSRLAQRRRWWRAERTQSREVFATRDDNRLLFYVPGGGFQRFPPGAVKRISAGNVLAWGLHYTPTGKPESDRHRLGLWFAQTPHTHEVISKRIGEAHIIEGREFVTEAGRQRLPADSAVCGRLADHRDHSVSGGCDALRAVAAHASARQGHDVHRDLPRRSRRGAAARAEVRLSLAAPVPVRNSRASACGQHHQGDRPLRQLCAQHFQSGTSMHLSTGRSRARMKCSMAGWSCRSTSTSSPTMRCTPSRHRSTAESASESAKGPRAPSTSAARMDRSWRPERSGPDRRSSSRGRLHRVRRSPRLPSAPTAGQ